MFKIELVEKLIENLKEAQRFQITIGDFTEDFFTTHLTILLEILLNIGSFVMNSLYEVTNKRKLI